MSDEDRIARMAHALCAADGQDPDEVVHLGADEVEVGGRTYSRDVLVPTWTTYVSEALRFVAAARTPGLMG